MKVLRAIAKAFNGSARRFESGEVVDVNEVRWRNTKDLERSGYIRELKYEEEPVADDQGRLWVTAELAAQHSASEPKAGGDRASSSSDQGSEPDAGQPLPGEYIVDHIGGGWYHILVDGTRRTPRPLRKDDIERWAQVNLPGYAQAA